MIYNAGDDIPTEWFSRFENVLVAKFVSDCEVSVINGERVIRQIAGRSALYFEGNGLPTYLEAAIPLVLHTNFRGIDS